MSPSPQALADSRSLPTRVAACLSGICLSLAAASAAATDYEVNPWIQLGAGYNDNITLVVPGPDKIGAGDGTGNRTSPADCAGDELEVGSRYLKCGVAGFQARQDSIPTGSS